MFRAAILPIILSVTACSDIGPKLLPENPLQDSLVVLSGANDEENKQSQQAKQETPPTQTENVTRATPANTVSAGAIRRSDPERPQLIPATTDTQPTLAGCPFIDVPRGAEVYQIFKKGHFGDQQSLIYQASLSDTSSNCISLPDGSMQLNVGIEGRLVIGPQGDTPMNISVPVAVIVRKIEGEPVFDKVYPVKMTLTKGQSTVRFTKQFNNIIIKPFGASRLGVNDVRFEAGFPPSPED